MPARPSQFDPRWKPRTGRAVLAHGLPALPDVLDHTMSIPVAFWTAAKCAVVMFLEFLPNGHDEEFPPNPRYDSRTLAKLITFARDGDRWRAHRWGRGSPLWSYDPVANPGDMRDLGGRVITSGQHYTWGPPPGPGYPAGAVTGRVAPAVKYIALIQDGREDRRPLQSHFGVWVVCTEHWAPYQINAIGEDGTVLDSHRELMLLPAPCPTPKLFAE